MLCTTPPFVLLHPLDQRFAFRGRASVAGWFKHQLVGHIGHQHLTAMADPVNAGDLVHRRTEEVPITFQC